MWVSCLLETMLGMGRPKIWACKDEFVGVDGAKEEQVIEKVREAKAKLIKDAWMRRSCRAIIANSRMYDGRTGRRL